MRLKEQLTAVVREAQESQVRSPLSSPMIDLDY
jgi:hypothetical protein